MKATILRTIALAGLIALCMGLPLSASAEADPKSSELYLQARERLIDEHLDPALELFRQVVRDHPGSDVADDAQYYVGYCLERQGNDREAIAAFDELLRKWPDSVRAESALARRAELSAREDTGHTDTLDWLRSRETSWEVRRDAAYAMARAGSLEGYDILEEALRREGTGRQSELVRTLAPLVKLPEARRLLIQALEPSHSTSVQMQAVQALAPALSDASVVTAFGNSLSPGGGYSTSVQLKALKALHKRQDLPAARGAISRALQPEGSTSVQIAACDALEGHLLEPEVRSGLLAVYQPGMSTSVQLKCLQLLRDESQNKGVIQVIQAALEPGISTSVQLEAVKLAASSRDPEIQEAAAAALHPQASTSVQLRALQSLEDTEGAGGASAIEELLARESVSTSVQLQALTTLSSHDVSPSYTRAVASALSPERSTSVQLRALELATPLYSDPIIRSSLMRLLGESDSSTSVQLKALDLLGRDAHASEVVAIIARSLRAHGSTSVQLKAVDILEDHVESQQVRRALTSTLDSDRSTSVVLESLRALERRIEDPEVRRAFVQVMEDDEISSTARVRAAEALVELGDRQLAPLIADAMEDVVMELTRRSHSWSAPHDLIEDALDVLSEVDQERADRLEELIE